MSVSRQASSTVCNHGNHKDVAPIIGSDGISCRCHTRTYGKPSPCDQSEGNVTQPPSSGVFAAVFCCGGKKRQHLRWKASCAHWLLVQPCFTFTPLPSPALFELFKFSVLLKGSLTCSLCACLLSSPRLPPAFLNPVIRLLHRLQPPNIKPLPRNNWRLLRESHPVHMLHKVEPVVTLTALYCYATVDYLIKHKCCESCVRRGGSSGLGPLGRAEDRSWGRRVRRWRLILLQCSKLTKLTASNPILSISARVKANPRFSLVLEQVLSLWRVASLYLHFFRH